MQYAFVQSMLRGIDALDKESSLRGLTDYPAEDEGAFWPCRHHRMRPARERFRRPDDRFDPCHGLQCMRLLCYNQLRKSESCCAPGFRVRRTSWPSITAI